MKRLGIILAAAAVLLSGVSASAQHFGGPRDYSYGYGHRTAFLGGGMTHFHAGVNPMTLTYKSNGAYHSTHSVGTEVGMASMIPMAPAVPFYLEVGFGAQYSFGNLPDPGSAVLEAVMDKKVPASAFGIKIPVNFAYVVEFGRSDVAVIPYAGIGILGNISGKVKVGSSKFDLYDDDSPVDGNRFILGGQFGCRFAFHRFLVGVGYEHSFTNVTPHVSASQLALSVGVIL